MWVCEPEEVWDLWTDALLGIYLLKNHCSCTRCSSGLCRKVPGQAPEVRPSVLSREGTASPASLCFPKEGPEVEVREVKALTKVIQQK